MQSIDGVAGETVNYTYDALNRLQSAGATSGSWAQQYTYDGFGNLTGMNGAAIWSYDPNSPRGDANGLPSNISGVSWWESTLFDMENRLIQIPNPSVQGADQYGYDPYGKRVFKVVGVVSVGSGGAPPTAYAYFYTISGQKVATIQCTSTCSISSANVYFGSKLIRSNGVTVATDRLGSVRANVNGERMSYYPYGQERTSTADGREKFGTYFRDAPGQDYADQRYYNFNAGAFWTPDPYKANNGGSGDPSDPASWNRYAYAEGDPLNYYDPRGLVTSSAGDGGGGQGGDDGDGDGDGGDGCENTRAGCGDHGGGGQTQDIPLPGNTGEDAGGGNLAGYQTALDFLKTFSAPSKNCQKDLTAVGLTAKGVETLASNVKFVSFTNATPDQQAVAIANESDLITNSSINTIYYVDPNLSIASASLLAGEMLHELIHDSGFGGPVGPNQDTALQKALHVKQDPKNTQNISKKLAKDCFK